MGILLDNVTIIMIKSVQMQEHQKRDFCALAHIKQPIL